MKDWSNVEVPLIGFDHINALRNFVIRPGGSGPQVESWRVEAKLRESGWRVKSALVLHKNNGCEETDVKAKPEHVSEQFLIAAEGINQGIADLAERFPAVNDYMRANWALVAGSMKPEGVMLTACMDKLMVMNVIGCPVAAGSDPQLNIGAKMQSRMPADSSIRDLILCKYRNAFYHELGHAVDDALEYTLTRMMMLIKAGMGIDWIKDHVSDYATFMPQECVAEVGNMFLTGLEVPKEFGLIKLAFTDFTRFHKETQQFYADKKAKAA